MDPNNEHPPVDECIDMHCEAAQRTHNYGDEGCDYPPLTPELRAQFTQNIAEYGEA